MKSLIHQLLPAITALLPLLGHAEAPKPNILFIYCDDLGYGDVGVFHQNERAAKKDRSIPYFKTPYIDRMAAQGIRFPQHYCAAPVCAPSRASLLTGTHQGHATIRDNQFDKELPDTHTIASVLKEAGYATAAFGKWGLQGKPDKREKKNQIHQPGADFPGWPSMPNDRGFDYFLGYVRHRDGHYHYPVEDNKQVWENKTEISKGMELCFSTDLFTAAAKRWIMNHHEKNPDTPFMVYLAHDTPHAKLQNPPCPYPSGGGTTGGVHWLGREGRMINTAMGKYDSWMHPSFANATWDHDKDPKTEEVPWPEAQKRYANNVRRIDDSVGDLIKLVDDLGIGENTLVIFSSDNGPSQESYISKHPYHPTFFHGFGPFDGIKRDTLEGGLRVPTIARWPKALRGGRVSKQPSGHWDWLATFADAAGLALPASSDGVSLLPVLTGKGSHAPSTIYSEYSVGGKTPDYEPFHKSNRGKPRGQMQVVHVDGYKGIRTAIKSADQPFEIYDLSKDPQESENLADKAGMEAIQLKMQARALQVRLPNPSAKRPYDGAAIPPAEALDRKGPGGIHFRSFDGKWPWMPDFKAFEKGVVEGYTTDLDRLSDTLEKAAKLDKRYAPPMGIEVNTYLRIPSDGDYRFEVSGRGHSMLFVHDIRLIQENPEQGDHELSATLPLKAGWHPIRYYYRTTLPDPDFQFSLFTPEGEKIQIDAEHACHSFKSE